MKANLVENQTKYSNFWLEQKVYEKRIHKNSNKPLFLVIDGPPYANGAIHMGHALNKILKDFILRWKNISGFQSPFLPGWDVHGLPIEHKVESETKDFKKLSLVERREKAFSYAKSQLKLQLSQLENLHLIHPLDSYYSTADPEFIEREYSLFKKLWKKGLVTREYKPVAWSYSSQTALAESEIEYEEEECESIYFFWKIVESNNSQLLGANIILWTTTPYSLESNLAIALNPELNYFLAKSKNGTNFIASENFFASEDYEIVAGINIEELLASKYLNNLTGEINIILAANFVEEHTGSGFVHLAPGLGPEDYLVCRRHNIPLYCPIDHRGCFGKEVKFPEISEKFYKDASKIVIAFLEKNNSLLSTKKIRHKVGKDWRTKQSTLYRATEQWFLNLKSLREELIKGFDKEVFSSPEWLFGKLRDTVLSREEWCISRQRAWGLPIPFIFKDGREFGGIEQLEKNISILLKEGVDSWYTKPISYFVGEQRDIDRFSKSFDVLDVWFDSGSVFTKDEEILKASIVYLEGGDQLRGWFNSSSILSIASKNCLPFTHLISHGFVLDATQEKMSKSRGNVVDPVELIRKYSSDVFRLWVASINYSKDISFSEEKIKATQQEYRKIRNILFRFSLSVIGKKSWREIELLKQNWCFPEHEYIYNIFAKILHDSEKALDSFLFRKVTNYFREFIELYSSWYLEIVKPALYTRESKDTYREEAIKVISVIFKYSTMIFSVIIPQTSEESYRNLTGIDGEISIFLEEWKRYEYDSFTVDSERWAYFFELRERVLREWDKQMGDKSSGEKLQLLRQQKLLLPKAEIKCFNLKDLTRLLLVAEIEARDAEEIFFAPTTKYMCARCCSYWNKEELTVEYFENQEYLLCQCCRTALQEYRENNKRKS